MQPSIALPREGNAAIVAPQQLMRGHHGPENAAHARLRAPDFAPDTGLQVGHANRPWFAGPLRLVHQSVASGGNTDKRNRAPIRRPYWRLIPIHAGIGETQAGATHIVDADK